MRLSSSGPLPSPLKPVHLGYDLFAPSTITWTWQPDGKPDDIGATVKGTLTFKDGKYTLTSLTLEGDHVTAHQLRSIPLREIARTVVVGAAMQVDERKAESVSFIPLVVDNTVAEAGPSDEALREVAKVYQLAYAVGDSPTKAVGEAFSLPSATASRWVRRARDKGYLGESEHGRARP